MSGSIVSSEVRFVGSLTAAADASGTVSFTGTGEQVTLSQGTAWVITFFQGHSITSGAGSAQAIIIDLTSSEIYARIDMTGQGSFAIDNNGRQISPIISSSNGSMTLTARAVGSSGESYAVGANLRQVYVDPTA